MTGMREVGMNLSRIKTEQKADFSSTPELEVGLFSDPGRRRTSNEDWLGRYQPADGNLRAAKGDLFLVADGLGGHPSGEKASRTAVDHIIRTYMDKPGNDVQVNLQKAIQSANTLLYTQAAGHRAEHRWGTTLVAAVVRQDRLWVANVGDSRAYLLRRHRLKQLSRDHNWRASHSGVGEPDNWIGRHVVTRALGRKSTVEVDLLPPIHLRPGDSILLCSDGLTGPVPDDEIQAIIEHHPPQEAAEELIRAANRHGGPDNISVILVRIGRLSTRSLRARIGSSVRDWIQNGQGRQDRPATRPGVFGTIRWGPAKVPLTILLAIAVMLMIGLGFILGLALLG